MQKRHAKSGRRWLKRLSLAMACTCGILWPTAGFTQSLDDTVQFISDMANAHGFVRTLSCRNPKAVKPTKITEVYSVIPTGTRLGTIELNHGHDEVNTGFTHFNMQDIDTFEYQGQDTRENNLVLYGVRISCNANGPCILKTSFCTGAVADLKGQFAEDTLLFRSASHAERMTKALSHFLTLVRAQQQTQPF